MDDSLCNMRVSRRDMDRVLRSRVQMSEDNYIIKWEFSQVVSIWKMDTCLQTSSLMGGFKDLPDKHPIFMRRQPVPSSTLPAPGHPVGECCRHRNCELGNPDWLLKRPVWPPAPSCTLALCNAANYGSLPVTLTCYSTVHWENARYGDICEFTALLLHHWHCQCQSIRRYHISGIKPSVVS